MKVQWLMLFLLAGVATASAQGSDLTFTINGASVTMPLDTPIVIDDVPATLSDLRYRPNGMQARWDVAGVQANVLAATPVFSYTLIGPVTQVSPMAVLGQPLTITADTSLVGVGTSHTLPLGTNVVVAGLVDANGSVLATLVERRGAVGPRFLLTGPVLAVGAQPGTIQVGEQWVSTAGVTFADCAGATPVVGEFVELRANAVDPFPPGSVLNTVTDARCVALVPQGTVAAIGFLEGIVTAVTDATRFEIGALAITLDPTTAFVFGSLDDLDPGVAVVVHGSYVNAQTLAATEIAYVRPVVRFEVPMQPNQFVPGVSMSPFGIPVLWSAQVRDQDGYLANGIAQPRQVQVRGYIDGSGQAYATRVRDRGNVDAADTGVRGPVTAIANPLLTIQGLVIDTTGATFVDEYGAPLDAATFFAGVQVNHMVDVGGAVYNATLGTLTGGSIAWIDAPVVVPRLELRGTQATITSGTVGGYAFIEPMFRNDFE